MRKSASLIIAVVLTLLTCSGCVGSVADVHEYTFFAMDTVMKLNLYCSGDKADLAAERCEARARELENLFSASIEASEISLLNKNGTITASADTVEMINTALGASQLTGGAFDATVYPLTQLWGFTDGNYRVPDSGEIENALTLVGYNGVTVSGSTVTLNNGGGIDLGGIAKGYLGDSLVPVLEECGVTSAVLSLGGNIVLVGEKPNTSPWSVAIRSPYNANDYLCTMDIAGGLSVVTSGGYERYFEQDGKKYHHIIDTSTGKPAESDLDSVTVIGEDGALCDALSTALFAMGKEKALAFAEAHRELGFVFAYDEGICVSESYAGVIHGYSGDVVSI